MAEKVDSIEDKLAEILSLERTGTSLHKHGFCVTESTVEVCQMLRCVSLNLRGVRPDAISTRSTLMSKSSPGR
jgi:hypothetical protein